MTVVAPKSSAILSASLCDNTVCNLSFEVMFSNIKFLFAKIAGIKKQKNGVK
ncbi:hypothetical protein BOVAB4_2720 [Bacteroides ovatus]|nr:hypothetical protein BOVAB4_2720 [Bacteroides ovatus]